MQNAYEMGNEQITKMINIFEKYIFYYGSEWTWIEVGALL